MTQYDIPASRRNAAPKSIMTPRERWLAALHLQPVDRLPFWPKASDTYLRHQAEPFRSMTPLTFHNWLGSDKHIGIPTGIRQTSTTSLTTVEKTDAEWRQTFSTPLGSVALVQQWDNSSSSWHPIQHPCTTVEEIRIMCDWYDHLDVAIDPDQLAVARARVQEIGEDASTCCHIGESPLMHWIEFLAGVENAHYLLADARTEVEALFDAMHRYLCRCAELICRETPADMVYMVENTSTTLISPTQYDTYCRRHIGDYAALAVAHKKPMVLHMCGHLKDLLPTLSTLPVRAFEAFTSPPVGNARLQDGRAICPQTCLIGGTNATLWMQPADVIISELQRDLDALPHHRGIVVTSAGVMPPCALPETIKAVCDWVKAYPV